MKQQDWQLTEEELAALPAADQKKYRRAVSLKGEECAHGPFGGWADGNNILISMGWTEVKRKDGPREFVSLEKPQTVITDGN
jgi:hypothetical protein